MLKNLRFLVFMIGLFLSNIVYAVVTPPPLPGSAEPSRATSNFFPQSVAGPITKPAVTAPKEPKSSLGPEAEKIKFKLTKIILEGNHVYSNQQLKAIYKNKLNTIISITELQEIIQSITNYYRNNGYILSRAILPPQHVSNGVIHIRIIEGYIDQVKVAGHPHGAKQLVLDYGHKIAESRPLQIKDMEYYLLLANQIPGAQTKAVLEPSKKKTGAADLNLIVEESRINASISYDNEGTRYIGPHEMTGSLSLNSILLSGDTIRATYFTATKDHEIRYVDLAYETVIGRHGLGLTVGGNRSLTHPQFVLEPFDTIGRADTYYLTLQYPYILARDHYLIFDGSLNYVNSKVDQLGSVLFDDHVRTIRLGGIYSFSDRFEGANNTALHVEQGVNLFGASHDPNNLMSSHFGADGIFTKINLLASHLQPLFHSRFSLFMLGQGQYTRQPLLVNEQFGFGGSYIGRGYDPSEILGDRGASATAELRMDVNPVKLIQSIQFYVFYDAGKVWNAKSTPGMPLNQSATSTGIGARFGLLKYISGNIVLTQVLTKSIAAEKLIGEGRNPKIFFNVEMGC